MQISYLFLLLTTSLTVFQTNTTQYEIDNNPLIETLLVYDEERPTHLIEKIILKDITVNKLKDLFNINNADKSKVRMKDKCYTILYDIVLKLDHDYNLVVTLNFPNDFSFQDYGFDYYEETLDDMINIACKFKIKHLYVRKNREIVNTKIKFVSSNGKVKLYIKK